MNFTRPFVAYAVTIFLSAFLLFEIEPIAGKFLLPAFGGTAAVWTTALLFFTGVLFLGYAYAYILSLYELRIQARVQVLALSAGILFVLVELGITHALHADLNYFLVLNPVSAVLITLFTSIGIPFFLLATTGPLLQQWYGVTYDSEPYRLYAFSNAGSLIALCAYPFFVEPFITLSHQQITWGIFFILFACVCAALSISQASTSKHVTARPVQRFDRSTLEKKLMWIVLSALPTCMLIATTTHLTRLIAPIPLLWLVLLGVYLITFIIAFTGIRIPYISVFVIAISGVSFSFLNPSPHDIAIVVVADVVLLWSVGTLCNQELYRLRPGSQEPALFYVFVSFGSLIGAVIASVIAPLIFSDYWEFPMGIVISMIVAAYILLSQHARISYTARYATIISLALVLIVPLLWYIGHHNDTKLYVARNFYGTVKIYDIEAARILLNGSTLHGLQPTSEAFKYMPVGYYAPDTAIGRAFMYERLQVQKKPLAMFGIGLGAGMTAAFCAPGDTFNYVEIDPKIIYVAHEYFSYLEYCSQARVSEGDGRKVLDADTGKYDLIVLDAFSDDSIPMHLLTREALQIYLTHLIGTKSIIAIHISNRYLDLLPEIRGLAESERLSLLNVETKARINLPVTSAHWVLLSPGTDVFSAPIFADAASLFTGEKASAWTDDYSNIVSAIRIPIPNWLQALK